LNDRRGAKYQSTDGKNQNKDLALDFIGCEINQTIGSQHSQRSEKCGDHRELEIEPRNERKKHREDRKQVDESHNGKEILQGVVRNEEVKKIIEQEKQCDNEFEHNHPLRNPQREIQFDAVDDACQQTEHYLKNDPIDAHVRCLQNNLQLSSVVLSFDDDLHHVEHNYSLEPAGRLSVVFGRSIAEDVVVVVVVVFLHVGDATSLVVKRDQVSDETNAEN